MTERASIPSGLEKPESCIGCPFHRLGKYYVPDVVVPGSRVYYIAEAPGEDEERGHKLRNRAWQYDRATGRSKQVDDFEQVTPQPLIGATGLQFTNTFLPLTGLARSEVSIGNAIRCRPQFPGKKLGYLPNITTTMNMETSRADIVQALRHCRDNLLRVPDSVELVVTAGRYSMFQLTGIQNEEVEYGRKMGVMESWRGYGVDYPHTTWGKWTDIDTMYYHPFTSRRKIFFTMHLAALWYGNNRKFQHSTYLDFAKIRRILSGAWPKPIPSYHNTLPSTWPNYSCFDTEYNPEVKEDSLIRWSLTDERYYTTVVEAADTPHLIIPVSVGSTVLMQNALADLPYLRNMVDMTQVKIEDLMLMDAVLYTGELHSLNAIASRYGPFNRHKHLNSGTLEQKQFYSALDAIVPMYVYRTHYLPQFRNDAGSWRAYKENTIGLVELIEHSEGRGSKINNQRLVDVQMTLNQRIYAYKMRARELTGNANFNLSSRNEMMDYVYDEVC